MKRTVLLLVLAVGMMMLCTPGSRAAQKTSPEWLTAPIECGSTPKEFMDNLMAAVGNAPTSYYNDVTMTLFLMYYTTERARGVAEPIGDGTSFNEMNALSSSLESVYGMCQEKKPFSLATFKTIEADVEKKQKTFSEEFKAKHASGLREHWETYHNPDPQKK